MLLLHGAVLVGPLCILHGRITQTTCAIWLRSAAWVSAAMHLHALRLCPLDLVFERGFMLSRRPTNSKYTIVYHGRIP